MIIDEIKSKLQTTDLKFLTKQLGYGSTKKFQKTLNASLASLVVAFFKEAGVMPNTFLNLESSPLKDG